MMKHFNKNRGVTLTELLVVVVIIGLLATIAVPVYVNKAEQARISIAKTEVKEIAMAQEACAITHGFYVPLQMLDDMIYNSATSSVSNPRTDDLYNEDQTLYLIYATRNLDDQYSNQAQLQDRTDSNSVHYVAVRDMYEQWSGPFLNPQRVAFEEEIKRNEVGEDPGVQLDFPLDPWGVPYRFYSPLGIIGTGANTDYRPSGSTAGAESFSDGLLTRTDEQYDRFAIVSWGPDGASEYQGVGLEEDDISYLFGGVFTESSFRAFY